MQSAFYLYTSKEYFSNFLLQNEVIKFVLQDDNSSFIQVLTDEGDRFNVNLESFFKQLKYSNMETVNGYYKLDLSSPISYIIEFIENWVKISACFYSHIKSEYLQIKDEVVEQMKVQNAPFVFISDEEGILEESDIVDLYPNEIV